MSNAKPVESTTPCTACSGMHGRPGILDSFQDAPGYPAEMSFFTVVDPAAPSIGERAEDESWTVSARLDFARLTVRAVKELHAVVEDGQPMVHRNLSPATILVMHDNSPVLTGFGHAKIPSDVSLADLKVPEGEWSGVVAPEVRESTLGVAGPQSDIYSLCASLRVLFRNPGEDWQASEAARVFAAGMRDPPAARSPLAELDRQLTELLGELVPTPVAPPARFWTEGQIVRFRGREYRIVARLGSGSAGTAFKVVELDPSTQEEIGTFVGKVAHNESNGDRVRRCYQLAREPISRHPAFSSVFEVATEWRDNEFAALLTWIEGAPLADFAGVLPLLAEQNQADAQELVVRWLRTICEALDALHRNGLVHGDVSPRNMIVSGEDLVLTDYDSVTRIGDPKSSTDTVLYSSPSSQGNGKAVPGDDLYALAASFFHVLFDTEPFRPDGDRFLRGALDWDKADREEYPGVDGVPRQGYASRLQQASDLGGGRSEGLIRAAFSRR